MREISSSRLVGKRAVIVGVSDRQNIGYGICERFLAEGARVIVAGRDADSVERAALQLGADYLQCDICDDSDISGLADMCARVFGAVDIVVNCTGWGLLKPYELTTREELERMCQLQFTAPFLLFQTLLPLASQACSLIQVSSATATVMLENHAAYMGTKAGFDHVMRCLANEFGARGVRANSISPGLTDSPMAQKAFETPGVKEAYLSRYPLGRIGSVADLAAAAVWLASDECFMTGENLQVNGGLTLRGNPSTADMDAAVIARTGSPRPRPWLPNQE